MTTDEWILVGERFPSESDGDAGGFVECKLILGTPSEIKVRYDYADGPNVAAWRRIPGLRQQVPVAKPKK